MQLHLLFPFLAVAAAQQSGVHLTVLPSESPTVTTADNWRCATEDIVRYFEPPTPTGKLSTLRADYGDEIQTCTYTGAQAFDCPFPDKSLWCGFSSVVPATLKDEYVAYGSTAASWWGARSSAAVELAGKCPETWWTASDRVPFGANHLNLTIIEAECYVEAHTTATMGTPMPTTSISSAFSSSAQQAAGPTSTMALSSSAQDAAGPTSTTGSDEQSVGVKRMDDAAFRLAITIFLTASTLISIL